MTRISRTNLDKAVKFEECTFNTSEMNLQRCLGTLVKKENRKLIKIILTMLESEREKEFKRKRQKYMSIIF